MNETALSDWLRLRESADGRARSDRLTDAIVSALRRPDVTRVIDLGAGAGSNLRFLAGRLPRRQEWLLVDRSARLLQDAAARTCAWAAERNYSVQTTADGFHLRSHDDHGLDCTVRLRAQDLNTLDEYEMFADRHLVTASALLDLVSERWLGELARHCRRARASALLTIVYDGHFACSPAEPEDAWIRARFNEHQLRDKGLGGPAQGPGAASCAARCFSAAGFHVQSATSNWQLGPGDAEMQRTLIDGWGAAALETTPADAAAIEAWRRRRLAHVEAGQSLIVVGHQDLAALPDAE